MIKKRRRTEVKKVALTDKSLESFGRILTWHLHPGGNYKVSAVMNKMAELGLPEVASEIRNKTALLRALRDACKGKDRIMEKILDDDIKFKAQISKVRIEEDSDDGKIARYIRDAVITFIKASNEIKCKNTAVRAFIEEKVILKKEYYSTTDITTILKRLFERHANIAAFREDGGCYLVPSTCDEFVFAVRDFVMWLNPKNTFKCPKLSRNDEEAAKAVSVTVKNSVMSELDTLLDKVKAYEKAEKKAEEEGEELDNPSSESWVKASTLLKKKRIIKRKIKLWETDLDIKLSKCRRALKKLDEDIHSFWNGDAIETAKERIRGESTSG